MTKTVKRGQRRRAAAGAALILGALSTPVLGAPQASAASSYGTSWGEIVNCAQFGPQACWNARDAMNWAKSVAEWRYPNIPDQHNNIADAFRHCAWTGAMTQRMGVRAADSISTRHEQNEQQPANERQMDLNNNVIGMGVGQNSTAYRDSWGYIWQTCESFANNHRLFGLNGRGSY